MPIIEIAAGMAVKGVASAGIKTVGRMGLDELRDRLANDDRRQRWLMDLLRECAITYDRCLVWERALGEHGYEEEARDVVGYVSDCIDTIVTWTDNHGVESDQMRFLKLVQDELEEQAAELHRLYKRYGCDVDEDADAIDH